MNIYVGNLAHRASDDELRHVFEEFGSVSSCSIIRDKVTGESRGFGFVEMPEASEAKSAIEQLNGRDFQGRNLTVNEARPKTGGGGRSEGGGGRR